MPKRFPDQAREAKIRQQEEKEAGEAEWKRIGPNWNTNFKAVSAMRRQLFERDDISAETANILEMAIQRNLYLKPEKFNKKIIPQIKAALAGKKIKVIF